MLAKVNKHISGRQGIRPLRRIETGRAQTNRDAAPDRGGIGIRVCEKKENCFAGRRAGAGGKAGFGLGRLERILRQSRGNQDGAKPGVSQRSKRRTIISRKNRISGSISQPFDGCRDIRRPQRHNEGRVRRQVRDLHCGRRRPKHMQQRRLLAQNRYQAVNCIWAGQMVAKNRFRSQSHTNSQGLANRKRAVWTELG
jgi:hypothetical protein